MKRNQARAILKELSAVIKMGFKNGMYEEHGTINEVLLSDEFYGIDHLELETFKGWRKRGYKVRKGSKGYIIWAKPKALKKGETEKKAETDEQKEEKWFPTCYLFTSEQVEPIAQEAAA